jgi:hypothetical protein
VRLQQLPPPTGPSVYDRVIPESLSWTADMGTVMPLVQHLKDGFVAVKPPAWHRNEERAARGLFPIHNSATQLEGWERELVWMEILLLTGNPSSSFRHLARGWGRDKGFHMVLAQYICERHGDVQRKKRDNMPNGGNATTTTGPNGTMTGTTRRRKSGETGNGNGNGSNINISANVWDDACYGDAAYNEALAADLLDFSPGQARASAGSGNGDHSNHPQDHAGTNGQREYSFELPAVTTTNPTAGPREYSFELLGNSNGTTTTTTTATGTNTSTTNAPAATMATSNHDNTGTHISTGQHMSADEAAALIQQQFQHLVHYPPVMATPNYGTGTYHQDVNDNNGMSKSVLEEFAEYTLLNSDQHRNESS